MTAMVDTVRWVPAGERILVGGMRVDAGALYSGEGAEPSAIDPTLPIDRARPDWHASTVRRPPRYAALTPGARAAYLVWRETGRRAPQAPAVWALLHLYGLERRILLDGDDDPGLRREIEGLRAVYGHDPDVARVADALAPVEPTAPPALDDVDEVPDELRVELGRRALRSVPVDAGWALAWAWFHPAIPRRPAARQAPERFAQRWTQIFGEVAATGLVVSPRRRRLTLEYTPANPSLPGPIEATVPDASDVLELPGPERLLREISERAESDLEPHVRWLRRHPGEETSAAALATVPHSLVTASTATPAVTPLVVWVRDRLADRPRCTVDGAAVIAQWLAVDGRTAFDRASALALAQVLERIDVGIEPDPRFDGEAVRPDHPAVLFGVGKPPVTSPSPAYATALLTLELCAAVAAADGAPDDAEDALLVAQVGRVEGLLDAERARLAARHDLIRTRPVDLADVAQRVGGLDPAQRARVGDYLLEVARVDGEVSAAERATLTAIHELLGLPTPDLDEPAPADPDLGDPNLGDPDLDEPGPVTDRLAATRAANAAVQELLAAIFVDEEDDQTAEDRDTGGDEPGPTDRAHPSLTGLDARHSALLRELAAAGTWSRTQWEQACARHRVLPDGALDAINEAALDATDDPVITEDDAESVVLDADVYREMDT